MSTVLLAIAAFIGGGGLYHLVSQTLYKNKVKEANDKADITIKEAELTAKRKLDEAENRAEKFFLKLSKLTTLLSRKNTGDQRKLFKAEIRI